MSLPIITKKLYDTLTQSRYYWDTYTRFVQGELNYVIASSVTNITPGVALMLLSDEDAILGLVKDADSTNTNTFVPGVTAKSGKTIFEEYVQSNVSTLRSRFLAVVQSIFESTDSFLTQSKGDHPILLARTTYELLKHHKARVGCPINGLETANFLDGLFISAKINGHRLHGADVFSPSAAKDVTANYMTIGGTELMNILKAVVSPMVGGTLSTFSTDTKLSMVEQDTYMHRIAKMYLILLELIGAMSSAKYKDEVTPIDEDASNWDGTNPKLVSYAASIPSKTPEGMVCLGTAKTYSMAFREYFDECYMDIDMLKFLAQWYRLRDNYSN